MEIGSNQRIMLNALIVAMETMLAEINEHMSDPTVLSDDVMTKTVTIKQAVETALKDMEELLVTGDEDCLVRASKVMMDAQAIIMGGAE